MPPQSHRQRRHHPHRKRGKVTSAVARLRSRQSHVLEVPCFTMTDRHCRRFPPPHLGAPAKLGRPRRLAVEPFRALPHAPTRLGRYRALVSSPRVPGGVVHKVPRDLREALLANPMALDAWKDITPLARNEFICWIEDAKQEKTRVRRIRRSQEELEEGQRRPCCWPGCKHRQRLADSGRRSSLA